MADGKQAAGATISVVGAGRVGVTLAFALLTQGIGQRIVLVGRERQKTLGDVYDLAHASGLVGTAQVVAGELDDTAGSDVVVVTASAPTQAPGRMKLAAANAPLMDGLMPQLVRRSPQAVFLIVTNPVDVMTWRAQRISGLPAGRVFGTGTLIDTARFRSLLASAAEIDPNDLRAYILGEHGPSQFPALAAASAGGARFEQSGAALRWMFEQARDGGDLVMRHKGYTNYAISLAATMILKAVLGDTRSVMPVSTKLDDYYGLSDVCLSVPCVMGRGGVERQLLIDLSADEREALRRSAAVVREAIEGLPPWTDVADGASPVSHGKV